MLWRDFSPFVAPYVIGCPVPVLEHHARLVVRDWCRKTLSYQQTLDLVPVIADSVQVPIVAPAGAAVVKVLAVTVGGRDHTLVSFQKGQQYERTQEPADYCYTADNLVLTVHQQQAADTPVVITAALMPALDASEVADRLFDQYAEDMAAGIVSAVMRLPKQDFTDFALAEQNQARYEARRATVAAKIARGLSAAKTRHPVSFY